MIRTAALAVCLAAGALSTPAFAQDCDSAPQFASHRTSNGDVRAASSALDRGEIHVALAFAQQAAGSPISPGHRGAAYANLCAALALDGQLEEALPACDRAVDMREGNWVAWNNRGAAKWLSGDVEGARADFAQAASLESGEDAISANTALSQCASAS